MGGVCISTKKSLNVKSESNVSTITESERVDAYIHSRRRAKLIKDQEYDFEKQNSSSKLQSRNYQVFKSENSRCSTYYGSTTPLVSGTNRSSEFDNKAFKDPMYFKNQSKQDEICKKIIKNSKAEIHKQTYKIKSKILNETQTIRDEITDNNTMNIIKTLPSQNKCQQIFTDNQVNKLQSKTLLQKLVNKGKSMKIKDQNIKNKC